MQVKYTQFIWLAVSYILWAASAIADDPTAPSLVDVVQAGLERYPERALSEAIRQQGEAIRRQASSLLAADAAVSLHHETDAVTENDGFRNWEGGVEMPLWMPGQRDRRNKVADATVREADATRRLQHWQVAGEVRELLWSLKMAAAEVGLAEQALDSARTLENEVKKRAEAGELARSDLILVQKETLAREIELSSAVSGRDSLMMEYRALTGLALLPVSISETSTRTETLPDNHPALMEARTTVGRGRAERDQTRAEKRASPVLTLGGKSERPESGLSYDTSLTVELHVPLGMRSQAEPRTAEAERRLTEASTRLARLRRELENKLNRARVDKQRATRALVLAEQRQLLAAEGLRLARRAFELGESDLFTLLQARAQALSAKHDLQLHRLEGGRAQARLNQALGVLPE